MVGGFLSSYWIAFQLKYICLYVYDTLGTMQDYLFQKVYLKALHCIGSLNLFWFCFEVIIAFGRSELSQLRGRYHYLIIQVLIYLRKSTFYRRVEEWNWWWSRIIKFSYTIVYLCQDIATISELFLLLLSCTKGTLSVIICFAINIKNMSNQPVYIYSYSNNHANKIVNIILHYSST